MRAALQRPDIGRTLESAAAIDVVAVGKAAAAMLPEARAGLSHLSCRRTIGISNHAAVQSFPVQWHVAPHPVPDERSVGAAHAVMKLAETAGGRDLLLMLISGGASAMMALPAPGIELENKRRTSALLLRNGADVAGLNAVRKHLSAVKGGQLAIAWPGAVLTLAVSDVVGDDLSAIGSGPTVADATTFAEALDVLEHHGGTAQYPDPVIGRLEEGARGAIAETPKAGDHRLARSLAHVIGGSRTALDGATAAAVSLGYAVHVIDEPVIGEARAAGEWLIEMASRAVNVGAVSIGETRAAERPSTRAVPVRDAPLCILAAGETTVRVVGGGLGGRNQECALAMVRRLSTFSRHAVGASVGTDGIDGPTDAAGAVVDTMTLSRANAAGLHAPEHYLENNDSYRFFQRLDDLVHTGPTSTNVGDLQVILIG